MKSIWMRESLPQFETLKGDVHTDVLIIGGGMAGILTAYLLQQSGVDYILVEKNRICSGITGHTTAKITWQHGLLYHQLQKSGGTELAQKYWQANDMAAKTYRRLCHHIDCDYEVKDNYVYSTSNYKKLEAECSALQQIGCHAELRDNLPLPIKTAGAVKVPQQAQFHPLKFAAAISRGLHIYEYTFVREMVGTTAITDNGRIYAKKVVALTHFPFINKHGGYFLKLYQHRSYVLALDHAAQIDGMYVDEDQKGLSFRNYGDLLLLGGGGHRTGKKGGNWQELRHVAASYYPKAQEQGYWATQDCMSLDGVPYIGQYSKSTPDFYVAAGFNKWGMTSSMVSAMLLRDLILDRKNDVADVFCPSRSIFKPQLLINGWEAVTNLLTPTTKRCPHLGCALQWNSAEHSWDCPCHGSRFSENGVLLDNPANGNLSE